MKVCGTCGEQKGLDEFSLRYGKPQYNCKKCHSEYRKKHYEENKKKYLDKAKRNTEEYRKQYYEWLSTKSCVDCGISDIRVLEQDHLRDKEYNISSKIGGLTLEAMMPELNKCEVVCANCHRIRTINRGGWDRSYATLVN